MAASDGILLKVDGRSGFPELERQAALIFSQAFEMFKDKQKGYGPGNIAKFGSRGVVVRMSDKVERLINILFGQGEDVIEESVEDTFLDSINYPMIGLLCRMGEWPGVEAKG